MVSQHDGPMTPIEQGTPNECEFVSIPEWCERVGCSLDTGYRVARRNEIPGLFRIGRLVRVNWDGFVASTKPPEPSVPSVARE